MKCLADNYGGFYLNAFFINNLPGEKGIIACVAGFVLTDDSRGRHSVLQQYICEELAVRVIIAIVNLRFGTNAGPFIPFHTDPAGRDNPFGTAFPI